MNCPKCNAAMKEQRGNVGVTRDGIEVDLMGTPFYECTCSKKLHIPDYVLKEVDKTISIKKREFPDSDPYLYVDVPYTIDSMYTETEEAVTLSI